jgi:queuine/archaeosine tRNA-ribosyltransferase
MKNVISIILLIIVFFILVHGSAYKEGRADAIAEINGEFGDGYKVGFRDGYEHYADSISVIELYQ